MAEGFIASSIQLSPRAATLLSGLANGGQGPLALAIRRGLINFLRYYQEHYLAKEFEGPADNSKGGRVGGGGGKWPKLTDRYRKWKLRAAAAGATVKTVHGSAKVVNPAPMGVLTGRLRKFALDPASVEPFDIGGPYTVGARLIVKSSQVAWAKHFDKKRPLFRVLRKDLAGKTGDLKKMFQAFVLAEIWKLLGEDAVEGTTAKITLAKVGG